MTMKKTMVGIDQKMFERMKPVLDREELSFSGWVRREMRKAVEERERVEAGRTQLDPSAIHGVAS